jgi:two-component system sensor histidine kinase UhpB
LIYKFLAFILGIILIPMVNNGKKYLTLFEAAPIGISIVDSDRNIIEANQTLEKIFRLPREDLINAGYKTRKYLHPDCSEMLPEEFPGSIALRENRVVKGVEIGFIDRDGQILWTEVSAAPLDINGEHAVVMTKDLTEKKIAEEALRESEERHRLLMEYSGLGVAYYSVDGNILMLNQMALKNLGGKATDYIGKNLLEIFGKDKGKIFIDRLILAASSENSLFFEDYVDLGGDPGWYHSTQTRILNQNGEVEGIQVIAKNITKFKRVDNKLRESRNKYQKLSRHMGEIMEKERSLIGMNLHDDLGQKLTALDLGLAWIRTRIGVQTSSVERKMNEMRLMINETIEQIKEIASSLRPSILFDLGLVPAISCQLQKFEKQTGIKCHFYYDQGDFVIDIQLSLTLYRILQESLTNISRHSGASTAKVTLSISKDNIQLKIKDDGVGIDKGKIDSLTSMGLASMKERAALVNGRILIRGKKDFGTMVRVTVPLKNVSENDQSIDYR